MLFHWCYFQLWTLGGLGYYHQNSLQCNFILLVTCEEAGKGVGLILRVPEIE